MVVDDGGGGDGGAAKRQSLGLTVNWDSERISWTKKREKISKPAAKTQMIIKWPLLLIESVLASVNLISCNSDARGQDNVYAEPKVIFFWQFEHSKLTREISSTLAIQRGPISKMPSIIACSNYHSI